MLFSALNAIICRLLHLLYSANFINFEDCNMKAEKIKEKITTHLNGSEVFTKEHLKLFFLETTEELSDDTLRVRINRLKSKGVIVSFGRGLYRLNDKKAFEPEINTSLKRITSKIKKDFPFLNYMIWSTAWLNDLATLQLMRSIVVLEVEAGSEEAVFRTLKENFPTKTFLNPKENEWEHYMYKSENIIVKTMISESPHTNYPSTKIAKLEKILVDLYCDKNWRSMFSSELHNIYTEACSNYAINYTTVLSYAARRARRDEIWEFIKSLGVVNEATLEMVSK